MIFNDDPKLRGTLWQAGCRMALAYFSAYNALLGLTEPTSLTAQALGPDPMIDLVQITQVMCAVWILMQAFSVKLRESVFAVLPFGFSMLSLMIQFWFIAIVGVSWLLASYYLCMASAFALAAVLSATNKSSLHRMQEMQR